MSENGFLKRELFSSHMPEAVTIVTGKAKSTLRIEIDSAKIGELKANGYKLCIAKKTMLRTGKGFSNVVWGSYSSYLCHTVFS